MEWSAFGGMDILVQTPAVFFSPDEHGKITDEQWRKTFDVNVLGSMIAADEAYRVMAEPGQKEVSCSSAPPMG